MFCKVSTSSTLSLCSCTSLSPGVNCTEKALNPALSQTAKDIYVRRHIYFPHIHIHILSPCDHKTVPACNGDLFIWVISLWATYLDFLSCLWAYIEHILIVETVSDFAAWAQLPLLSLSLFLKVIHLFRLFFCPISASLSLFQFCYIKSKSDVLLCHVKEYTASYFVLSALPLTTLSHFGANTASILSSADYFLSVYRHYLVMHTVSLFSRETF